MTLLVTKSLNVLFRTTLLVTCLGAGLSAWAQSAAPGTAAASPTGAVLSVGGTPISEKTVAAMLATLQSQGKTITPQLREQVIAQLIAKRVLLDEAKLQKIDQDKAYLDKLEEVSQGLLIEALLSNYLSKQTLSEAEEKAEYARQRKVLGEGPTAVQYQLRQVLLKTEQEARNVIARAKKGESFEKLAAETIDASNKANGGLIGWVFPSQLLPAVNTVVSTLPKGAVTAAPIQTPAGWAVVKVEDVRDFKIPDFEESRVRVRQTLMMQRQQAYIESLVKKATIKQP
jgi:peptidyl-prolyl cis-trans isomerase C